MAATIQAPGQPSTIKGFLNLRGRAVPVIALRRLFGFPGIEAGIHTPLIVMRMGETLMGLLVDRVDEVMTIDPEEIKSLAEHHSLNECAREYVNADAGPIALLDCERLLLAEEEKRIGELQAGVQLRLKALDMKV